MGLFDRFRKNEPDAKLIRDALLYALRMRLAAFQGAEARGLRSLTLYLAPPPAQRAEYEAATWRSEPGRFRAELSRIADDYDLALPSGWELHTEFVDALPAEAAALADLPAALHISGGARSVAAVHAAQLRVLVGKADRAEYPLLPGSGKVTIGREQKVQLPDGFVRINTVAFLPDSGDEANRFVSRQHAHISYDTALGQFLLFADAGGLPPHNKTKVKSRGSDDAVKLQSAEVPHLLRDGDQIMLGHSALLEFCTDQKPAHG